MFIKNTIKKYKIQHIISPGKHKFNQQQQQKAATI